MGPLGVNIASLKLGNLRGPVPSQSKDIISKFRGLSRSSAFFMKEEQETHFVFVRLQ